MSATSTFTWGSSITGMTEDVAHWQNVRLLNFPNPLLGSIPCHLRVRGSFSVPPSQLLCRLVWVWPPFISTSHTQMCAHDKGPICCKRVGLTAGGMATHTKIMHIYTRLNAWRWNVAAQMVGELKMSHMMQVSSLVDLRLVWSCVYHINEKIEEDALFA